MLELNASWVKGFETIEELHNAKREIMELTHGIADDVAIMEFEQTKELYVSVLIFNNVEFWDKKISEILGEKRKDEDYDEGQYSDDDDYWDESIH